MRGRNRVLVGFGILAALAAGTWAVVWRPPPPTPAGPAPEARPSDDPTEPPAVTLDGSDPAIVRDVREAEAEVRRSPRSSAAWGRLGMVLAANYFVEPAMACWARAERLDPREPRWPYYQGVQLVQEDGAACLPKFRRAAELAGDDGPPAVRLRLAEALAGQGHFDEAEELFRAALRRNAGETRAHLGLARLLCRRGEPRAALDHVRRALEDQRGRKAAHQVSAEAHQRLGDREAAGRAARRAAELPRDSDWPDPWVEAVSVLQTGRHAWQLRVNHLLQQGQVDTAVRLLRSTLRDYPDSYVAWYTLGQALLRKGDAPGAEEALRSALRVSPEAPEAEFYLGYALFFQDRFREAETSIRAALERKPDFAEAHYTLAKCLLKLDDRAGAVKAFRDALRCKPDVADAHASLGELLFQAGEFDSAKTHLQFAVDLVPTDLKSRELLEQVRQKQAEGPKK